MCIKDYIGSVSVRLGINRFNYKVPSGLYILGKVNEKSPILVTSNYKLTFDNLRKNLNYRGCFILVLDTKGINVWCAAGKGTFSSKELIYQINRCDLKNIVKNREIILPQLGASSIEPHLIRKYTGFKIIYGPVRSEDILEFLDNNYKCSKEMRKVNFTLLDRLILTPLEFVLNMKYILLFYLLFLFINFINNSSNIFINSFYNTIPFLIANIIGSVIFPALLYVMPSRSFSLNGVLLGLVCSIYTFSYYYLFRFSEEIYYRLGIVLLLISYIGYISFNFTGSTTYTSFSGVKKEAKISIPVFMFLLAFSIILLVIGSFK